MTAKNKKLYMIGNAHIDPVWLWTWQEGFHEVRATFRSALDRMDEYPDFVFVSSAAAYYEWIEQSDPAMFAEIRRRVAEGRWQVAGGWWIQPDCNIPSGESFARQGLAGQRYFREKLGVTAQVGYNVDSFGHNGMLPQILRQSGLEAYVFMRPGLHEKTLPARLFWWEAPDGSRVLAFRIAQAYCTGSSELRDHISDVAAELNGSQDALMCFYGVGNHGGGPTRENIESILALQADPDLPELVFSSPAAYFDAMLPAAGAPVVRDDLQHHASGCYAAHAGVKRWNRRAENHLLAAEKFCALAAVVTGQPYPTDFTRAWKNVLFNQFHDILAGTSLETAYDDARDQLGEATAIADRALNAAIQSVAWQINIPPEPWMTPIAVFNPHAWDTRGCVEVELSGLSGDETLLDDQGRETPFQLVQSQSATVWRKRLCFAAELPALGYRLYRLIDRAQAQTFSPVSASPSGLENDLLRIAFDPHTGCIASLYEKTLGVELLNGPAALPVAIDDPSDTWSHGIFAFDRESRAFQAQSVELVEQGPVKAVMRVTSVYHHSTLIQEFAMFAGRREIEVAVTVEWREQQQVLKLRFPLALEQAQSTAEIPFGHIQRAASGQEEPCQAWIDLSGISPESGQHCGLSLLNDGKYSYDACGTTLSLTVLRSPIYAHHAPYEPIPGQQYTYMDQGMQRFTYTLLPHPGSWVDAGTVRRAAELNQRPITLITTFHSGPLPQSVSCLRVSPANLVVSAVKQAEDGPDLIVRCYETAGVAVSGRLELPMLGRVIEANFAPCQIKTFRVPRDASLPVRETNLIET